MIFDDKTPFEVQYYCPHKTSSSSADPHIIYRGICNILMPFLEVKDLHASIDEKEILSGFSLNLSRKVKFMQ